LVLSALAATPPCAGGDADVPVRFVDVPADDVAWLEDELAAWVRQRDRRLCLAREGDAGLTVGRDDFGATTLDFTFQGQRSSRSVSPGAPSQELFRYQLAAAAEELVRSTWEGPPPPRFAVLARVGAQPLATGPLFLGGAVGAGLYLVPSLRVELLLGASAALPTAALDAATVIHASLSVSWLPVEHLRGVLLSSPSWLRCSQSARATR